MEWGPGLNIRRALGGEGAERGVPDRRHGVMEWHHFPPKCGPGKKTPGELGPGQVDGMTKQVVVVMQNRWLWIALILI